MHSIKPHDRSSSNASTGITSDVTPDSRALLNLFELAPVRQGEREGIYCRIPYYGRRATGVQPGSALAEQATSPGYRRYTLLLLLHFMQVIAPS